MGGVGGCDWVWMGVSGCDWVWLGVDGWVKWSQSPNLREKLHLTFFEFSVRFVTKITLKCRG